MKTTTVYKLTDERMTTHRGHLQWQIGEARNGPCLGPVDTCFDAYPSLAVAALMDADYVDVLRPRCFLASAVVNREGGLKLRCTWLRLEEECAFPRPFAEQRSEFAVRVVQLVCTDPEWNRWAADWLAGDRDARRARKIADAQHESRWQAFLAALHFGLGRELPALNVEQAAEAAAASCTATPYRAYAASGAASLALASRSDDSTLQRRLWGEITYIAHQIVSRALAVPG